MKKLLMCVLILGTIRLTAQEQKEVQAIPELQEWYSWKGGSGIVSYLPDFDSVGGGKHAITQGRGYDSPTWYNRFSYDTTNQFTWTNGGAYYVVYGDFNGDGIRDYWTVNDFVYRGIKKGAPPSQIPDTNYFLGDYRGYKFIADYNNDGFDDMLQQWDNSPCTNCHLFRIVWGGKELKKLKQSTVGNFTDMKSGRLISVYKNENEQWRMIAFQSNNGAEEFYIYDLRIINTGDIPTIELKELDVVRRFKSDNTTFIFSQPSIVFLNNTHKKEKVILASRLDKNFSERWKIENDKFSESRKSNFFGSSISSVLNSSITGSGSQDYIHPKVEGNTYYFMVFASSLWNDTIPKAFIPYKKEYGWLKFYSIGDVNNDGIDDVAGSENGVMTIYLGMNTLNSANTDISTTFSIHQNEPNPVSKERKTLLPLSLNKSGNYSLHLYDIKGTKVQTLFEGFLNEGETKLPLDLQGLLAGMYIVRMSDGKQTRERAIMIGE